MAIVRTAISLQKALFDQVETLAREMNVSRSRVFVLALESFLLQYRDRQLLEKINKAVSEAPPDETESARLEQIRRNQRLIRGDDW